MPPTMNFQTKGHLCQYIIWYSLNLTLKCIEKNTQSEKDEIHTNYNYITSE